ncbi:unnamed protein product [Chironomus riparius]|uniref:Uncharacterized protein n=1 Tax=Chironomus riparius TaxID=315576 RepID=A0A9N9WTB0_9DIPT|nr:unnamed protein product [Chironomus riparius]
MYRAFSILYCLILFCSVIKKSLLRQDPMEIIKEESHMKKEKSLFTKEHNNIIRNVIASLWHL